MREFEHVAERPSLHPARQEHFAFCERLYFDNMGWIVETLGVDLAHARKDFAFQWRPAEVRIIAVAGRNVGWLQSEAGGDVFFLKQLQLEAIHQRQGIGTEVMRMLIDEAGCEQRAIYLEVVKINPARRLYERLGFRVAREGDHVVLMRRSWRTRE